MKDDKKGCTGRVVGNRTAYFSIRADSRRLVADVTGRFKVYSFWARDACLARSKPYVGHGRDWLGFGCGPRLLWGDARY